MKKSFQLEIKSPCDADIKEMDKTDIGFFCNLCNKNVIDFSEKSKAEIKTLFFANRKICGKFNSSQMGPNKMSVNKINIPLKYIFLTSILFSKTAFSQKKENNINNDTILNHNQQKPETRIILGMPSRMKKDLANLYVFTIKGNLIINDESKKKGLNNTSIYILGSTNDALLDELTGSFSSEIELEKGFTNFYVVISYKKKSITKMIPFDHNKITDKNYYQNIILNNQDIKDLNMK